MIVDKKIHFKNVLTEHFHNTEDYSKSSLLVFEDIIKDCKKLCRKVRSQLKIVPKSILKNLCPSYSSPAMVKAYVKDHKEKNNEKNFKTRIIANMRNSPIHNLSCSLYDVLVLLKKRSDGNDLKKCFSKIAEWEAKFKSFDMKFLKLDI